MREFGLEIVYSHTKLVEIVKIVTNTKYLNNWLYDMTTKNCKMSKVVLPTLNLLNGRYKQNYLL